MGLRKGAARLALGAIVLVSIAASAWVASIEPNQGRNWDERYSMRNVEGTLVTGSLRPVAPYYPSLAHLPQTAVLGASHLLHRLTASEAFAVRLPDGGISPIGYRLARWVCVLFGAASLIMTFSIGRRLFSLEVGLLAAFFLAGSPWFIATSSVFKPDALLVLLTLVTFWWSLQAAEKGTLSTYLLAGAGVGLATASKQNGLLACLPLITATIARSRRILWVYLAAAGLISLAVFFALNPFPEGIAKFLWQREMYAAWAKDAAVGAPRPPTLVYFPRMILAWTWHGKVVGAMSLLGLAGLSIAIMRDGLRSTASRERATFVAFPLAFTAACAVFSSYPKENILIPVLPFTALAAAWTVDALSRWTAKRLESRWRQRLLAPGLAALLILVAAPTSSYVYREVVPETVLDAIGEAILDSTDAIGQRTVFHERQSGPLEVRQTTFRRGQGAWLRRSQQISSVSTDSLATVPEETLDLADFEVFPEARLRGPEREFYGRRLERPQNRDVLRLGPRLFQRRGAKQIVLIHPWRPVRKPLVVGLRSRKAGAAGVSKGRLPRKARRTEVLSFDLELTAEQSEACRLFVGKQPLALYPYSWEGPTVHLMSRRFSSRGSPQRLRLDCRREAPSRPRPILSVWRWSPDAR